MIRWDLIILFFLVSCITAGITFLILGLEKNTNESEETRKTYKWVGVGLLIFGGVGMLFWLYFKYRNRSKPISGDMIDTKTDSLQQPLLYQPIGEGCTKNILNFFEDAKFVPNYQPLKDHMINYINKLKIKNPYATNKSLIGVACKKYKSALKQIGYWVD